RQIHFITVSINKTCHYSKNILIWKIDLQIQYLQDINNTKKLIVEIYIGIIIIHKHIISNNFRRTKSLGHIGKKNQKSFLY
ncbi:hypothetical protein ACJX0J_035341, partial [Zea mays]